MLTRINLLPQEYRKKEMTPMGIFLPVVSSLAVLVAAGFFWGWLHFAALANVVNERDSLKAEHDSKQPMLSYLGKLREEEGIYKSRGDTIMEIASSRTLWSKKLDQLVDVIVDDENGERYLIRVDELNVKEPMRRTTGRNQGPSEGDTVTLSGFCFNDDDPLEHFNFFHEAVKQSDFFMGDFLRISKPDGQVERPDKDLRPSKAWTVKMDMVMKGKDPTEVKRKGRSPVRARGGR
jgi:Tfp pilus assembly protein PilN